MGSHSGVHAGIQLIVGLGNPGPEYENTRHNAGAWFVLALAEAIEAHWRYESRFQSFHCVKKIHGYDCHLLIPTTFMNRSGQAVKAMLSYYKIPPDTMLVAHDDLDVPIGDIRLKLSGGHGGHNGLRDILTHIGTPAFYRLRVGIGRPSHSKEVIDYVLMPPQKAEREQIQKALDKADGVLPFLLEGDFQKAMRVLHG